MAGARRHRGRDEPLIRPIAAGSVGIGQHSARNLSRRGGTMLPRSWYAPPYKGDENAFGTLDDLDGTGGDLRRRCSRRRQRSRRRRAPAPIAAMPSGRDASACAAASAPSRRPPPIPSLPRSSRAAACRKAASASRRPSRAAVPAVRSPSRSVPARLAYRRGRQSQRRPAATPVSLAPIAYNLGVSVGWKRFAVAGDVTWSSFPRSRAAPSAPMSVSAIRAAGSPAASSAAAERPLANTPVPDR